jgi:hypothetical protein
MLVLLCLSAMARVSKSWDMMPMPVAAYSACAFIGAGKT